MRRSVKTLIWLALIMAGLLLAAVVIVKVIFTKERILSLLTPRIEQAVNRPVTIGDAGISVWGGVGVWLGDVTVGNRSGFSHEPMLVVHKLEFKARLWPLLAGRVELDRVLLDHPSLLLEYDREGNSNLAGLRPPSDGLDRTDSLPDEAALAAPITVDHFVLSGGEVVMIHAAPSRRLHLSGLTLDLRTSVGTDTGILRFGAAIAIDSLAIETESRELFFHEGSPHANLVGTFDRARRLVRFDTVGIAWFGAELALEGGLRSHDGLTEVQLSAAVLPTPLSDVSAQLLKAGVLDEPLDFEGTLEGELEINGLWPVPSGRVPDWSARLNLTNLTWRPDMFTEPITAQRIEIRGAARTVSWTLARGAFPGGSYTASGSLDHVFSDDPEATVRIVADCAIPQAENALALELQTRLGGNLHLDVSAFGTAKSWHRMRVNGQIVSDNLVIFDPVSQMDTVRTAIDWNLRGHDLELKSTRWRMGDSHGFISGRIANLVPALVSGFDSPDVPRAELKIDCGYVNLDRLIGDDDVSTTNAPGDATADTGGVFMPAFAATGVFKSDTVIYSGMTLTSVRAPFAFRDYVLTMEPIRGNVYGGTAEGVCRWDLSDWEEPSFAVHVRADSIGADGFLTRYLGWAGGLTGRGAFVGEFSGSGWDRRGILPTLRGSGRAEMASGRLESAPLLASMGAELGYAGLAGAHVIRDLLVTFQINNGRILTDSLHLWTDDTRWTAVGSFGFDNTLDYLITAELPENLSGTMSGLLGGSRIHLGLKGTPTAPVIELDVKDAGQTILRNLLSPGAKDSSGAQTKPLDMLKGLLKKKKP